MKATLAPGKVIVSAVIDQAQRDHLLRLAREGDRSLSAELRRAVAGHLAPRAASPNRDSTEEPTP